MALFCELVIFPLSHELINKISISEPRDVLVKWLINISKNIKDDDKISLENCEEVFWVTSYVSTAKVTLEDDEKEKIIGLIVDVFPYLRHSIKFLSSVPVFDGPNSLVERSTVQLFLDYFKLFAVEGGTTLQDTFSTAQPA